MGKVTILSHTTKKPITMIGEMAGVCWGADTGDPEKNYRRGWDCIESGHGRTFEFPDVYMVLEGYSARVMREWYTHIGGAPTRLQESTRYIDYGAFEYVTPASIDLTAERKAVYDAAMRQIRGAVATLETLGVPREDAALLLPLGMISRVTCKHNMRNLIDMSHVRECVRAYWEFREVFGDLKNALAAYSEEWERVVNTQFMPKCEMLGYCPEKHGCGRMAGKEGRW